MSVRASLARLQERTGPIDTAIRSYRSDRARYVADVLATSDRPSMTLALALADIARECEDSACARRERITRAAIIGGAL